MSKKINKLIDDLRQHKYRALLGRCPRVIVDYSDGHIDVELGRDADYVEISQAVQTLGQLCNTLLLLKHETKALTSLPEDVTVGKKTDFSQGV